MELMSFAHILFLKTYDTRQKQYENDPFDMFYISYSPSDHNYIFHKNFTQSLAIIFDFNLPAAGQMQ